MTDVPNTNDPRVAPLAIAWDLAKMYKTTGTRLPEQLARTLKAYSALSRVVETDMDKASIDELVNSLKLGKGVRVGRQNTMRTSACPFCHAQLELYESIGFDGADRSCSGWGHHGVGRKGIAFAPFGASRAKQIAQERSTTEG